jgi:hypothetical protein
VTTNPKVTMDAHRFRTLAESYGAKIARWPAGEQHAATAFLAQSPDAARLLDEQRRLDQQLDALTLQEPSPRLLQGVAEIPLRHGRDLGTGAWWPFARLRNAIAVVAAATAMGAAAGTMITPQGANVADAEEWDALSSVAFALDLSEELSP